MFEKILIAVDLNEPGQADNAIAAAKALGKDDTFFLLVTVIPPVSGANIVAALLPKNYDVMVVRELTATLDDYATTQFPDRDTVACRVVHGSVYEEINRTAEENDCDTIVLCAAKSCSGALGPNAARVARYSGRSVFIVR